MKRITTLFSNKRGEGHLDTGIKIIIAVVIGALILGGLYLLFAGDDGIMGKVDDEVQDMMDIGEGGVQIKQAQTESGGQTLQYSYDGKRWLNAQMPDYGAGSTIYGTLSGGEGENASRAAVVQNGNTYYVLASKDGIVWTERYSFTAQMITHFYYGTSSQLPKTAGSFTGEKFVLRYWKGGQTYYTSCATDATTWKAATWSDLILV